jgi:adenosylhomocysteine nucleosidase
MNTTTVVLVSANSEWEGVRQFYPEVDYQRSPFGEWFRIENGDGFIFFQGGWGKISAAASTQYVIDRWHPDLLVNLGTCGGFDGEIERGAIVLVNRTVVYDIIEQMTAALPAQEFYETVLDVSWIKEPYPFPVTKTLMISGDRDLVVDEIEMLKQRYRAVVGDWESGAIAWVAHRNRVRLLILRGVSDLVGRQGGEVYGNYGQYQVAAREIMQRLIRSLPDWLNR